MTAFVPGSVGIKCSVASSPYPSSLSPAAPRPAILAFVAARAAERARLIRIDAEAKHLQWLAELEALRTPPNGTEPESPTTRVPYVERLRRIAKMNSTDASRAAVDSFVGGGNGASASTPPPPPKPKPVPVSEEPAVLADVVQEVRPGDFPPQSATTPEPSAPELKKKSEPTVSSRTAPLEPISEAPAEPEVVETQGVLVEETARTPEPVAEPAPGPSAEPEAKPPSAPMSESTGSRRSAKSFGAGLVEAIVEGVGPVPATATDAKKKKEASSVARSSAAAADRVIPPNILAAVNEGKLKALTVTKLRRMLSECGLKTAGRKSELIARLTSYVNS